ATRLAKHLSTDLIHADELMRRYEVTGEIARFMRTASRLPRRTVRHIDTVDQRLKQRVGGILNSRDQTKVECRTFVSDRLRYIDDVIARHHPSTSASELGEITAYVMRGAGQ